MPLSGRSYRDPEAFFLFPDTPDLCKVESRKRFSAARRCLTYVLRQSALYGGASAVGGRERRQGMHGGEGGEFLVQIEAILGLERLERLEVHEFDHVCQGHAHALLVNISGISRVGHILQWPELLMP